MQTCAAQNGSHLFSARKDINVLYVHVGMRRRSKNPKLLLSGSVCAVNDRSWVGGDVGVGVILCMRVTVELISHFTNRPKLLLHKTSDR